MKAASGGHTVATDFVAAVVDGGVVQDWTGSGVHPEYFREGPERDLYDYVNDFINQHGRVPKRRTIREDVKVDLPKGELEPPTKYAERLRERFLRRDIQRATERVQEILDAGPGHIDAAVDEFARFVVEAKIRDTKGAVVDFRDAYEYLWPLYRQQWDEEEGPGVTTGYPYLDRWGPVVGGNILSVAGRSAMGKTFCLLFMAAHAWVNEGKTVMFVTPEMSTDEIMMRLAAMVSGLPLTRVLTGKLTTTQRKRYLDVLKQLKHGENPFHVIDATVARTPKTIAALARQLRVDAIYVDGAYLLDNEYERDRYKKVAVNMDELKNDVATALGLPVFLCWQFKAEVAEKLKRKRQKAKIELEDIGHALAIGQNSTIVLGLFEVEGIESLIRRRIDVLKGRQGTTGEFFINWLFEGPSAMDFAQASERDMRELPHVDE